MMSLHHNASINIKYLTIIQQQWLLSISFVVLLLRVRITHQFSLLLVVVVVPLLINKVIKGKRDCCQELDNVNCYPSKLRTVFLLIIIHLTREEEEQL